MHEQPCTLCNHNTGFADCRRDNFRATMTLRSLRLRRTRCSAIWWNTELLDAIADRDNYLQLDCYSNVVSSLYFKL